MFITCQNKNSSHSVHYFSNITFRYEFSKYVDVSFSGECVNFCNDDCIGNCASGNDIQDEVC